MEIITIKDAKERGEKYYYTGKPCKKGHLSKRLTLNRACYECKREHARETKPWNREGTKQTSNEYQKANPIIGLMERARNRAKVKGIPFNLEYADVTIPDMCPILNIPLFKGVGGKPCPNSPSLDRVVPELGYVKGNVRVISHRANTIKNDASIEEMQAVIAYIQEHLAKQES